MRINQKFNKICFIFFTTISLNFISEDRNRGQMIELIRKISNQYYTLYLIPSTLKPMHYALYPAP